MNKLMRKVVVLMVAFSMLFAGAFASGSTEVQAATTPAKVTIKSAKANYWHDEIFVSWKSVKTPQVTRWHLERRTVLCTERFR